MFSALTTSFIASCTPSGGLISLSSVLTTQYPSFFVSFDKADISWLFIVSFAVCIVQVHCSDNVPQGCPCKAYYLFPRSRLHYIAYSLTSDSSGLNLEIYLRINSCIKLVFCDNFLGLCVNHVFSHANLYHALYDGYYPAESRL